MLVVGVGASIVYVVWWLLYAICFKLGFEKLGTIVHHGVFVVATIFVLGMICAFKVEAASVSYGAFILDSCVAALFFWLVRGEFRTVWMLVALVGLAIWGVTQLPPIKAKLDAGKDKARKDAMLRTAKGLEEVEAGLGRKYIERSTPEGVARRKAEREERERKVSAFGAFMKQYEKKPGDPDEPEDSI